MPSYRHFLPLILSLYSINAVSEDILLAVASNFTTPMKSIVAAYEKASGHRVKLAFGSSGMLYAQIKHGAPYQAFFSADQTKPRALEASNSAVANQRFTYAIGALALYSANNATVDKHGTVLAQGRFNKLAIANPALAPYGVAAIQVLHRLGIEHPARRKLIQGENIAQAFQFVATGNADLGLVSLSQVLTQGERGSSWTVPEHLYDPIRQDVVLLLAGQQSKGTSDFLQFIRSEAMTQIIHSYGYQTDDNKAVRIP